MKKPKISVNKLGEFMSATSVRQKGIVKDQAANKPPGFKAFRYTEARAACVRYFTNGFDESIIDSAIEDLKKKTLLTEHDKNDQKTSIESLNEFKEMDFKLFDGLTFYPFSGNGTMEIAGVDVTIYPDLIIRGEHKKKKIVGAVKIHIGKTEPLKTRSQQIVATILNQFIEKGVKAEQETAMHLFMYSIDIFSGSVQSAPKAQAQILANVDAACWSYKLMWESIKGPQEPLAT